MHWFSRRANNVNEVDRAISRAISSLPPTPLDTAMKALSGAANHSKLWFALALLLALRKGTTRKAAVRGVLSIAATSPLANAVLKPLLPRRRPAASELPAYQTIANPPRSSSFPSGHSASAAAFATAVAMESPRTALAVVPLAAAVAYSRIHVGVHWTSDVVVGAAVGTGVALATERWWPVREQDEARARPLDTVPELPEGKGLVIVSNQRSGDPQHDPADELEQALPRAVVVPTGTLNHFARDVGVYDLQEAVDATGTGQAVAVDLALVDVHPGRGDDPKSPAVMRLRAFVNTASIGP